MSSIKVKIAQTDASLFISTGDNSLPSNFDFQPQYTAFEWGSPYQIENYKVIASQDIVNWNAGIEAAYRYICLYPNETGYPNLGAELSLNGDILPYLSMDGKKSMARVIEKLGLSDTAIADFSLIYSWAPNGASLNTDSFKAFVTELQDVTAQVSDESQAIESECLAVTTGGGDFEWPAVIDSNGNVVLEPKVCSTQECCQEYKEVWQLAKLQTEAKSVFATIGVSADTITKKHIYKFAGFATP